MTEEWKEAVRVELASRGASEQWLADQIATRRRKPMKRDTINKLLRFQDHSALVPDICEILGIELPMTKTPALPDEETRRMLELFMAADPAERRAVLLLLERRSRQP